ncbi:carbohydrate ABC transporter permease [Nakamurella endophytica]|uniref:ABC transporter permease n=1 Tax=Nakamurella endophytica TaxID=1748367 RepID=A0A917T3Q8_9ACTN|nr:sugar ABC transporter permease [Nakamurella endophytica]GGM09188.1 ABC transporter permease [Nakamurella endophytica]
MTTFSGQPGLEQTLGQAASLDAPARPPRRGRSKGPGIRGREGAAGWLFVTPTIVIIGLFLLLPVFAALWVSLSDWTGKGSPLGAHFVGMDNYDALLGKSGLAQRNLATSLRNNLYYVILVVPLQTILALGLALVLNRRRLRGKGFFRTAFYFPSVTSSVAIAIVFLFLFNASGVVNAVLQWFGVRGPNWFADPRGVLQLLLGALGVDTDNPPSWLSAHRFLGLSWWQWLSGPSIAMCAIIVLAVWTTGGTFMLMFLAALQDIPADIEEAAAVDGASGWQTFRKVILPQLKPTLYLVVTLGLIGTWQVFDAIYIMSQGQPSNTTLTPAFLSYRTSFTDGKWGQGAAIAFILFAIIVVFSLIQRFVMRERKTLPRRRRFASWEGK